MKKKLILKAIAIPLLILGLLFIIVMTTPVGYIVTALCGVEYYSKLNYELHDIETDGRMPPDLINVMLGGSPPKRAMPIPCILFTSHYKHKTIIVNLRIPQKYKEFQYIELSKLTLRLDDNRTDNMLPVSAPIRFFLGNHEHNKRYRYYSGRHLRHTINNINGQEKARFDSTLWPPTKKATLIVEGTLLTTTGENKAFKQVSTWLLNKHKGFRKVSMP